MRAIIDERVRRRPTKWPRVTAANETRHSPCVVVQTTHDNRCSPPVNRCIRSRCSSAERRTCIATVRSSAVSGTVSSGFSSRGGARIAAASDSSSDARTMQLVRAKRANEVNWRPSQSVMWSVKPGNNLRRGKLHYTIVVRGRRPECGSTPPPPPRYVRRRTSRLRNPRPAQFPCVII